VSAYQRGAHSSAPSRKFTLHLTGWVTIRKRLAKWMARDCFRQNTKLEGFHDRISEKEMKGTHDRRRKQLLPLPFAAVRVVKGWLSYCLFKIQ
jgi:hypothetical protein